MRYFIYLLLYVPIQLFAYLITPLLPLFARMDYGPIDNANGWAMEPRLVGWLSLFGTYDNSLWGDNNWKRSRNSTGYFAKAAWLYRNSFYTGKIALFGMPIQNGQQTVSGNPLINHHTQTYGSLRITQPNGAWQYKAVKPFMGRILVLNLGWLLDDASQSRALFMLSPRWKSV